MKTTFLAALGAVSLIAAPALAEVSGAELSLGYSGLADGGARDLNKMTLGAGLEFALSPAFSVQGDLAKSWYGEAEGSSYGYGLHGVYHLPSGLALGGFAGHEKVAGDGVDFFGLEAGGTFGMVEAEGALTWLDREGVDGFGVTLRGEYALAEQLAVGGKFASVAADTGDAWRLSGTGAYQILPGLRAEGELGLYDGDSMSTETFVGFGLRATFGGDAVSGGGTSFGKRGLSDFLPGL
ncbi:MAG: hypothetical protein IE922_05155 [Sphingomonadales bacterium]|nr:hypothetical protein [Sphingomonadales bacterium]